MLPELTVAQVLLLVSMGVSVGALGAIVGVGGGILLVPALLIIFPDVEPSVITTISLTAVVLNALSATTGYRRRGWQDTRTATILVMAAVPAAIVGAFLTRMTERGAFELAFGIALILGSLYLLWRGRRLPEVLAPSPRGRPRQIVDRAGAVYRYRVREPRAAIIAMGAGLVAAFFGIGGGIINVPVMMLVLRMPARMSVATSQMELMIASAAALAVHLTASFGDADPWIRGLIVGAGTITGAQIGVRFAGLVSGRLVLIIIAVVLAVSGVRQVFAGLS